MKFQSWHTSFATVAAPLTLSLALSLSAIALPSAALAEETVDAADRQAQPVAVAVDSAEVITEGTDISELEEDNAVVQSTVAPTVDSDVDFVVEEDVAAITDTATHDAGTDPADTDAAGATGENSASPETSPTDAPVVAPAKTPAAETVDANEEPKETLTGEQYIDGHWYYYDENGNPVTGWHTWADGTRSYFGPDGAALEGLQVVDGETYYFDPDNSGHSVRWEKKIDGRVYYFDSDFTMWTGWLTWNKDHTRTYFSNDGAALSEWQTVGGKRYYFDPDNWCHGYRWEHRIGDDVYYFDSDCHMWTGWLTWKKDKTRSYFGADGAALSGWQTVGGKRYYFDPDNWCHGYRWEHKFGDDVYYFDSDCHMWTGWLTWNKDRTRSYFGSDGAALSGWQTVQGKKYYFDPANWCHGYRWEHRIGGKVYYFDADCHMWTGWLTWNRDKTRSYFGSDGAALSGWQTVGGKRYYFDPTNWNHGYRWEHWMGGKLYYFDSDCHMWTGWLTWKKDKTRSYFGSDGAAVSGWKSDGSKRYYIADKTRRTVRWEQIIDGKEYYFNGDCVMVTGVITFTKKGIVRVYGADGAQVTQDGFVTVNGSTYYVKNLTPLRWEHTIDGKRYYFDENYRMYTGWLQWKKDGSWSFFGSDGAETTGPKGWFIANKKYYFCAPGGSVSTWKKAVYDSWQRIKGKTSGTQYLGVVSIGDTYVSFFQRQNSTWVPIRAFYCTVGARKRGRSLTPTGTFKTTGRKAYRSSYDTETGYYEMYWTEFIRQKAGEPGLGRSFHSIPMYNKTTKKAAGRQGMLGQRISSGCVRLGDDDVKWVYYNVNKGTTIHIY
jgi:glucan-binding YG repeat protein